MAFKTFAPGVLTSSDVNTFLMRQAVITCTSSTRPASPSEGMTIYETNTDLYKIYNGSTWVDLYETLGGAWTTFTPTWTNLTVGNATQTAAYVRVGRMVTLHLNLTFGSTTSVTADMPYLALPVSPSSRYSGADHAVGTNRSYDANTTSSVGGVALLTGSNMIPTVTETASAWGFLDVVKASVPFTWTTSDRLSITATYEAAS